MPRKLPWLAQTLHQSNSGATSSSAHALAKVGREASPEILVDENLNSIAPATPPRRVKKRIQRTPSTSPPPAPPDVEYMREGYDADDIYMMVEDEFFSTAKMFTQHLHHAEYVRFKKLAASRAADTLDDITRPVDGRTEQSVSLQMKNEARANGKKIAAALKKPGGEDDASCGEEDDYMQDVHLAGLMTADVSASRQLSELSKPKPNTRAAAGLPQSPRKEVVLRDTRTEKSTLQPGARAEVFVDEAPIGAQSTTDDDDLDRLPAEYAKPKVEGNTFGQQYDGKTCQVPTRMGVERKQRGEGHLLPQYTKPLPSMYPAASGREDSIGLDTKSSGRNQSASMSKSDSTSDAAKITPTPAASDFLAKRRAERERKEREAERKGKSLIDVPTFAI